MTSKSAPARPLLRAARLRHRRTGASPPASRTRPLRAPLRRPARGHGPDCFHHQLRHRGPGDRHAIFTARLAIDVVTLDTGRLFPETLSGLGGNRTALRPAHPRAIARTPQRRGLGRATRHRWLPRLGRSAPGLLSARKVEPLRPRARRAAAWITGLRAEQSADRAVTAYAALDPAYHLLKVNPLLDWTRERVLAFRPPARYSLQRAARSRLPLDRLRALHARGRAG